MKVLDLFSGIGGFSLGLERAGFETALFCENDPACQKVLEKHWPRTPIWDDVTTLNAATVQAFAGSKIDLICGGFPCQDISVAGGGEGLEGSRSGLWYEYKRIINEIRPKYVLIENVANLRSKGLGIVLKDLWSLGYDAEWDILSACSIGGLHRRERVFILAYPSRTSSDSDDLRLERATSPEEEKSEWRTKASSRFSSMLRQVDGIKPAIRRGYDGISYGMDKPRSLRIKQLGNSVLPQFPQLYGEAIMKYEIEKRN